MKLIFIYGAPAAGKLTTANELSNLIGFKVFHNHLSIDAVAPIFDFGTAPFWNLVNKFRLDVLTEAARADVDLIYTFCYAKNSDDAHVAQVVETICANGGAVCFVLLKCELAELERRVVADSRGRFAKLKSVETLREVLQTHDLYSPVPHGETLEIDNTDLSATAAAKLIADHFKLL